MKFGKGIIEITIILSESQGVLLMKFVKAVKNQTEVIFMQD